MKEAELREHAKCSRCKNPIGHSGVSFWTVKIDRHMVDMKALRRNAGLAMQLGSVALASIMGPDEDLTKPIMETLDITLCETCSAEVLQLVEECQP